VPDVPPDEARFLEGIRCFNQRAFFAAHEVWEDLWREDHGPSRTFVQGLIQLAVCLHHFGRGNARGARRLYHSGRAYLLPYAPHHQGLDVDRLLADMALCCAELTNREDDPTRVTLNPELIPTIRLTDEATTLGAGL
jgi:uncharacterized protein